MCTKSRLHEQMELENVFVKHYAPNHMPDPKGEWSLKENTWELHLGICSKVNQFIYTLVCNYMPNIKILALVVLQIFCSQGCSYIVEKPGRVAQSVGHLTRKSRVLGSIPGLATYFRFSFRFFKKGSCQLLAKVCARSTG